MAIAGAPRLVTQTASALRVSNETESGFVQQANTGLVSSLVGDDPIFVFDDRIVARRVNANGSTDILLYDLDLNLLHSTQAGTVAYTFAYNALDKLFVGSPQGVAGPMIGYKLNDERTQFIGAVAYGITNPVVSSLYYAAEASADGFNLAFAQKNTGDKLRHYYRTGSNIYTVRAVNGLSGDQVAQLEWARNGAFLLTGSGLTTQRRINIYVMVGSILDFGSSITLPGSDNASHRIALSPDGVFLAVSTVEDDEGLTVYNTYLYKRGGEEFMPVGSIPNFGSSLAWNEQGDQLYDAGNRRAFKRTPSTNTFVELVGFMSNIPAGVLQSATSPHIAFPVGQANFFDNILFGVLEGSVSMEGWKIALLDESYVFDSGAINAAPILTASEVYGAHWPQGGKELVNVQLKAHGARAVFLDADDVEQTIYEGSITARFALVYDPTTSKPLIYVDFQEEVIAELNSKLTLKMGDFGFILISP